MPRSPLRFLIALFVLAAALRAQPPADPLAHLRPGHPRLLLTDEQLTAAVTAAQTDPLRAALHARIIAAAEAQLATVPVEHVLDGPRLLEKSRTALGRVLIGAMAWRLTGDTRFADRAKREMLVTAAFVDWNPSHFLDVAEMCTALGLGYDWLYAYLTPTERATIRTACAPGTPLTWRLLTDAKIKIIDAHHAELTQAGRTLRVEILDPAAARFTTAPATPPTSAEKQNKATTVLAAELPAAPAITDARLVILLPPTGDHWPAHLPAPTITSLTAW